MGCPQLAHDHAGTCPNRITRVTNHTCICFIKNKIYSSKNYPTKHNKAVFMPTISIKGHVKVKVKMIMMAVAHLNYGLFAHELDI